MLQQRDVELRSVNSMQLPSMKLRKAIKKKPKKDLLEFMLDKHGAITNLRKLKQKVEAR